jgi:hypothetical protein
MNQIKGFKDTHIIQRMQIAIMVIMAGNIPQVKFKEMVSVKDK